VTAARELHYYQHVSSSYLLTEGLRSGPFH
jgi:hypothetical protein